MDIKIHDVAMQARIQKQMEAIDAKICRGIAELDRGEGIPEDRVDAYLKKIKAQPE